MKSKWNVGDYVKVREDLAVGETYGKIVCQDHDVLLGETVRISENINGFYKLEGEEFLLFSQEMLEEAQGDVIANKENVAVIEVQAPQIEQIPSPKEMMPFLNQSVDVDVFVNSIKDFVTKHRKSFKNEHLFWEFFYEKLVTELKLRLK